MDLRNYISKAEVQLRGILGAMLILGVIALLISEALPWKALEKTSEGVGIALLTAGLLGLSVDRILKIELARDAFQAAFRYVLPLELKDEVARIINYKFLCTKHHGVIRMNDDVVRVDISIERTIKNISGHTETYKSLLHLDEWGFAGLASTVTLCIAEYDGQKYEGQVVPPDRGSAIGTETTDISVRSGGEVVSVVKGYEFHRSNGLQVLALRHPTLNPVINVTIPDDLEHECSFGVPGGKVNLSRIANRYELNGTQFPGQHIKLRWWPKKLTPPNDGPVAAVVAHD
jgi:hypothetical protein